MGSFLAGRKILLVEDEMLVLMLAEDLLADFGCMSVAVAGTVEEALALIDTQEFDGAILDMNLHGHSSTRVADALAAHDVPFIFVTGYVGRDMPEAHADRPLLMKPYRPQELRASLKTISFPVRLAPVPLGGVHS